MPTAVKQKVPNINNKDEKIEVNDEELFLFQVDDDELFLAVHSSGSIEIVFKTSKHSHNYRIKNQMSN